MNWIVAGLWGLGIIVFGVVCAFVIDLAQMYDMNKKD